MTLPRSILLLLFVLGAMGATPPDFTLAPIYEVAHFTTPLSGSPVIKTITLPADGSSTWIVSIVSPYAELQQSNGTPITADDTQVTSPTRTVQIYVALTPDDGDLTFIFSIDPPGTPARRLGLCSVAIFRDNDAGTNFGGAYLILRDDATNARIVGASVIPDSGASSGVALSELGQGIYRYTFTTDESQSFSVTMAGYQNATFNESLVVGAFVELNRTLTNTAPLSVILSSVSLSPTSLPSVPLTITFSKPVADFDLTDLTVTNGSVSNLVGGPRIYTCTLTPDTAIANVSVTLAANQAHDAGAIGNDALASPFIRSFNNLGPTVTIDQAAGQSDPTSAVSIDFTATFSEAVSGLDTSDVVITGASGSTITIIPSGTTASVFTVTVSNLSASGTITASLRTDAGIAAGGRPSKTPTSTDNTITYNLPTPPAGGGGASSGGGGGGGCGLGGSIAALLAIMALVRLRLHSTSG